MQARREWRSLVSFVEAWSELGEPPRMARLAQARGLFQLRLLDRAAARVQELGSDENDLEVQLLLAKIWVERGAAAKAKRAIELLSASRPGDPEVRALIEAAERPVTEPTPGEAGSALDVPNDGLGQAERWMALGHFLRARAILEPMRGSPDCPARVTDLLWAMAGELRGTESLADYADRFAPQFGFLPDLPDIAEDSERTESVPRPDEGDAEGQAFPLLFKHQENATSEFTGFADERTQTANFPSLEEIANIPTSGPGPSDTQITTVREGDTQIVRVVHHGGGDKGNIHKSPSKIDAGFDLAAFRREMGMEDGGSEVEEEDDGLIERRGAGGAVQGPAKNADAIGTLQIDRAPVAPDEAGLVEALQAQLIAPAMVEDEPQSLEPDDTPPGPAPRVRRSRTNPMWGVVLLLVFAMGGGLIGLIVLSQIALWWLP